MFNKKAVSPLIATVLLVMIVVSIGAAVMVVIQGITQEQIASTEAQQQLIACGTDVEVGLFQVGTSYRICLDEPNSDTELGNFSIYLENKGLKDISDWRITIVGNNSIEDQNGGFDTYDMDLDTGEIKLFEYNWTGTGVVDKIRLSPKIPGGPANPLVTCSEPNLEWDSEDMSGWDGCEDVTWDSR